MVKKRLSDLLREEAQKPAEEGDAPPASPRRQRSPASQSPSASSSVPAVGEAVDAVSPSPEESPGAATAADPTPTEAALQAAIAPLEETIADLEESLRVAKRTEDALRQEVTHLEVELADQRTVIQTLTTELDQVKPIKRELEQAKQLILQLSEGNLKLTAEMDQLKQAQSERATQVPVKKSMMELRNILRHPVQVQIPSTTLSNADIGWVD